MGGRSYLPPPSAKGAADRSYGVQVAKLAGLPTSVIARARQVLAQLEDNDRGSKTGSIVDDLPLFSAVAPPPAPVERTSELEDRVRDIMPDSLTPREALNLIYELRDIVDED